MGREVKRVPLDFVFPLNKSYYDAAYEAHEKSCPKDDHDKCDFNLEPPVGDGWQLWQTVSDGPVTPVFATAEELIDYMSQPVPVAERSPYDPRPYPNLPGGRGWHRETAEKLVRSVGWMPSMMQMGGRMLSTDETVNNLASSKK